MADINTAFVQQIFHISKRKWKPDVHHHRQADHLRAGFKVAKWRVFCHPQKLSGRPARLMKISSGSAAGAAPHITMPHLRPKTLLGCRNNLNATGMSVEVVGHRAGKTKLLWVVTPVNFAHRINIHLKCIPRLVLDKGP